MRLKSWLLLIIFPFVFTGILSTSVSARRIAEASDLILSSLEQAPTLPEHKAGILLTDELNGRFSVRDSEREVVAEILKPSGRSVELRLEPGIYRFYVAQDEERYLGVCELGTGDWVSLHPRGPRPADREPMSIREAQPRIARSAGGHRKPLHPLSLAQRHQIEVRFGYWDSGSHQDTDSACSDLVDAEVHDVLGALSYAYWIREDLSVYTTFRGMVAVARSNSEWSGGCENSVVVSSLILGIRQYPLSAIASPVRPYLTAGIGPYWGVESWNGRYDRDEATTRTEASFGGHLGGGIDIQMGRYFMAGINAGYNLMADFASPLGGKENYGGVEVGIGLSLLLGSGVR